MLMMQQPNQKPMAMPMMAPYYAPSQQLLGYF
jgi:hypothetical protein